MGEILGALGRGGDGQINGLPLANNGSGVIYNRTVFEQNDVEPPKTWDEFIALCDKLKAAGVDPFCWGFKDNWTGAPMLSSISGDFLTGGVAAWYEKRRNNEVSFSDDLKPVFVKMKKLASYGNTNKFDLGYNDANQVFSKGRAAMYIHGTYAIPAIRSYNSKIDLGTFAMPADKEENTKIVSGVDVALTMPSTAPTGGSPRSSRCSASPSWCRCTSRSSPRSRPPPSSPTPASPCRSTGRWRISRPPGPSPASRSG